ncbi:MAG: isoleucine--tRNA ligase [Bacilli bacterium]|nr:isoleucine--tRNA ligase [Bacilli bacterium]
MSELKDTLLMPKGGFEMRAGLTLKEPKLIARWQDENLYEEMNKNRMGCEEFLLHDGPPYANGDIHCGHMLNRLLKDFAVRYKNMSGYKTPFIFGWDTHGLPIEVRVTKSGVNRKAMSVAAFRSLCMDYAKKQVAHQKEQILRLGCLGDYDHPYLTLLPEFEARQIDVFATMALKGYIYKGEKPVYWSPSSESALAEAEVEYADVPAKTMYVAFDFVNSNGEFPEDAKIIIWTTTPWTIPSNRGITLNPRFEYGLFDTNKGKFVFLASLKDQLAEELGFEYCNLIKTVKGQALENGWAMHPMFPTQKSIIMNANFVTDDSGTGCVHTDPDHGLDDFNACMKYGIKPQGKVDDKGVMHEPECPRLDGLFYEDGNNEVVKILEENGHLLKEVDIVHSYPHDWRTHKPVIFRATPQWFCSISPIREQLLEEVHKIKWVPAWGEGKMVNMIKDRADWCISRQRAWGVPIPIIYNEDDSPIVDEEVFKNIRDIIAKEGSNAWFEKEAKDLLPAGYTNEKSPNGNFRKETDIMDVWFDSGSSWNGVLVERGYDRPADVYLEGNDQYRGWFNSSMILSVATKDRAPFKTCVTHGWVMDENWNKMSKSAGNGIDPSKVANQFGADILRLWASNVDYVADVRISESIITTISDQYRKVRNTFKFMLGNLQDGEGVPYVCPEKEPKLSLVDKWILTRFAEVKNGVLDAYDAYSYSKASSLLVSFMVELSNFYLNVTKDTLYNDEPNSKRRKAAQYVIYKLSKELCLLWNPILPFTMDEVYSFIPGVSKKSPQLDDMPKRETINFDLLTEFKQFENQRRMVLQRLENSKNEMIVKSFNEATVDIFVGEERLYRHLHALPKIELANLFGVSSVQLHYQNGYYDCHVAHTKALWCDRCRNFRYYVAYFENGNFCPRCRSKLEKFDKWLLIKK